MQTRICLALFYLEMGDFESRWLNAADATLCALMSSELFKKVPYVLPFSADQFREAIQRDEVVGVFRGKELSAFFRITLRPEFGEADTVEVRSIRSLSGGVRDGLTFLLKQKGIAGKRIAMVVLASNQKMITILEEFGFQLVSDYQHDPALLECLQKDTGPRPSERLLFVLHPSDVDYKSDSCFAQT